jgi:hypothetical protein
MRSINSQDAVEVVKVRVGEAEMWEERAFNRVCHQVDPFDRDTKTDNPSNTVPKLC